MFARLFLALLALGAATPAWADGGTPVPEASNLTLFALGVAGVLIGRHVSRRREGD